MQTISTGGPPRFALAALAFCLGLAVSAATAADAVENRWTSHADAPLPRTQDLKARFPDISGIDASTGTCYREEENSDTCFIEWAYLYVTAGTGHYMIDMRVEIDGRLRAFTQGFFQDYMYIPAEMVGPGFAVPCGLPGASGLPTLGNVYGFVIRARDTSSQTSTSSGTISCPSATGHIFSDGFEGGSTAAWF